MEPSTCTVVVSAFVFPEAGLAGSEFTDSRAFKYDGACHDDMAVNRHGLFACTLAPFFTHERFSCAREEGIVF